MGFNLAPAKHSFKSERLKCFFLKKKKEKGNWSPTVKVQKQKKPSPITYTSRITKLEQHLPRSVFLKWEKRRGAPISVKKISKEQRDLETQKHTQKKLAPELKTFQFEHTEK